MIIINNVNPLEDTTDQFYRIFCTCCYAVQSSLLNYFLIYLSTSSLHFLWILVDVAIIGFMIFAFVITYLRKRRPQKTNTRLDKLLEPNYPGELPYAYSVWLVYSIILVARLAIIYKLYVTKLTANTGILSPSALNLTIGISLGIVYFLIRSVSMRGMLEIMKQAVERWIMAEEALNILDAIDILTIFYSSTIRAKLPTGMEDAVLAFGLITLIFPVIHFGVYATTKYDTTTASGRIFKAMFAMAGLFLVNLPLGVLRFILWLSASVDISAFLIKNIVFLYIYIVQLVNAIIERNTSNQESGSKSPRKSRRHQPKINYGFSPRPAEPSNSTS